MSIQAASNIPYSQRRREAFLKAVPRVALDLTDGYVAGMTAYFRPPGAGALIPVLNGGLAAFHVGLAIGQAKMAPNDPVGEKRAYAMALGELITAAGFVGLAAGLGPWALPIVALGEVTTNFSRFS